MVCFRPAGTFSVSVAVGLFVGLTGLRVDVAEAKCGAGAGHLHCPAAGLLCGAAAYAHTPGSFQCKIFLSHTLMSMYEFCTQLKLQLYGVSLYFLLSCAGL